MKAIVPSFILTLLSSFVFISCEMPLFLTQVEPLEQGGAAKPEQVLSLLQESYEFRDIVLFESLIYNPDSFVSYTEPGSALEGANEAVVVNERDIPFDLVPVDNRLIPLRFSDELQVHRNLLTRAEEITFLYPLTLASIAYHIALDTLESGVVNTDTLLAVVKSDNSMIRVEAPEIEMAYGFEYWDFAVSGQYFLLKQDDAGIWKIWKWIESREQ